jgi:hypothetical protein
VVIVGRIFSVDHGSPNTLLLETVLPEFPVVHGLLYEEVTPTGAVLPPVAVTELNNWGCGCGFAGAGLLVRAEDKLNVEATDLEVVEGMVGRANVLAGTGAGTGAGGLGAIWPKVRGRLEGAEGVRLWDGEMERELNAEEISGGLEELLGGDNDKEERSPSAEKEVALLWGGDDTLPGGELFVTIGIVGGDEIGAAVGTGFGV